MTTVDDDYDDAVGNNSSSTVLQRAIFPPAPLRIYTTARRMRRSPVQVAHVFCDKWRKLSGVFKASQVLRR
jgi:hypothetical protein